MKKKELEARIKELEFELSKKKSSKFEFQKSNNSEQHFRNLLEHSIDPILILKGKDMILDRANEPLFKIFNIGKEALGKPFLEILPEMKDQPFINLLLDVFHNHTTHSGKEQPAYFIRENGAKEIVYFNFVYHPYKENDGAVSGVIVYATDVTEQVIARKKAQENEFRFQSMVYTSPSMIAIFKGKDMIIEIANDSILESCGKGKDSIGKPLFEVLPEAAEQGFDKLIQNVYETGEPYHAYETPVILIRNGKQELMHYNFIYQPQRNVDGVIEGVALLANEVTPQALLKKALVEQREIEQKALKSIEESKNRYYSMLMQSPFAFCIMMGKDMVVVHANDLMKEFWGKGNDVEGKALLEILPEIKDQPFPEMIDKVYTTGTPVYANEILGKVTYNGQLKHKYFNVVFQPYYEAEDSISGVTQIAYEVTEMVMARKKIEESELRFRLLADLMPAKISYATSDGSVTYFNKHWLDFSGYNFEELRDFGYLQIMHPEEIEEFQNRFQKAALTLTDLVMEMRFKNKDGEYIWHLNIASPIKDEKGNLKMWIGVTTDISEQIKTRENNLLLYEKHANELKLAKDLADLATLKAVAAVNMKQQFLSNMSHEIRTPLNSIVGFTNVLMKTELNEKQNDFVQAIKTSSNSLNILINDILDLAKVDAGKMTFENKPFEILKSIKSLIYTFDLKLKEKNLEFISDYDSTIPSIVVGDSVRLNQIILNLMSNAVKFTNRGEITLSIKLKSEVQDTIYIEFSVTDSGIGIAEDKIDSIFNLFEQAEITTSSSYGGTGLGLAIVKDLVALQGGNIHVSSTLGIGSVFNFILPFGKTTMKRVKEEELLKLDSKINSLRVLVAEDVALNQLLIKIILGDFGFEYEVVSNGKIAIEKLKSATYDIVLMDLHMPEMDGFQATEYIRKIMKSNIPIIALTADVTTVDVAKCKEFGMNDYVSKPIDENQLYSKIKELVNTF